MLKFFPDEWKYMGEPQFYVPEGWVQLVSDLHDEIVKIAPEYEIHQVKEKFGGLRYYIGTLGDEFDDVYDLIRVAENKSYSLCQVCGAEGKPTVVKKTWITVVCNEHLPEGGVFRD